MSEVRGKVEIIFHARAVPLALSSLATEAHISGEMVNAVVPEERQEAALDALRRERIPLISLNPVRGSLEEYYVQKLQATEISKGAGA